MFCLLCLRNIFLHFFPFKVNLFVFFSFFDSYFSLEILFMVSQVNCFETGNGGNWDLWLRTQRCVMWLCGLDLCLVQCLEDVEPTCM